MKNTSSLAIATPEITHSSHSQFTLTASAVRSWLGGLPLANLGEATRLLFKALSELSHTACKPKDRFEILEVIRPRVHHILKGLSPHYLNRSVALPEKSQKIVVLANTLNSQLANGYCQAFQGLEGENKLLRSKNAMITCLHRALTEHSRILLRTCQLYRSTHPIFWLNAHKTYQCAYSLKILKPKVTDSVYGNGTIRQAYLRLLMLSCSKTHQLPQRHIEEVFNVLNNWSAYAELRTNRLESCVFLFNPTEDAAPAYRELIARAPSLGWLGIDTRPLVSQIGELTTSTLSSKTATSPALSKKIIDHLSVSLSSATSRATERIPCNEPILITVGMNTTHFYVANQLDFSQFQFDQDQNEHLDLFQGQRKEKEDVWGQSDGVDKRDRDVRSSINAKINENLVETISYSLPQTNPTPVKPGSKYEYLRSRILDTSSSGCRIEWPEDTQIHVRSGELVGLKTDDYDSWRVGIVRWLRSDGSHQIGIETLASAATPYSARLVQSGLPANEYQRAMLLPGTQTAQGSLLLLSGVVGISEGHTIALLRPGHAMRVKLGQIVEQSNAFKLFRCQDITPNLVKVDETNADESDNNDFNQLWDTL